MEHTAHAALQGLIDHLVLLHPRLALEGRRDHPRRIVIAVTGEVFDQHLGIRQGVLDQALDLVLVHRHPRLSRHTRSLCR